MAAVGAFAGRVDRGRARGRAGALLGALLLHLMVLTPVVWGLVGRQDRVRIDALYDPLLIPLDLRPPDWPTRRGRPGAPTSLPHSAPVGRTASRTHDTSLARTATPPSPHLSERPASAPNTGATPGIEEAWRVGGPGRAPWGGDVCRDVSNFRAWQAANCRETGPVLRAEARGSAPAEVARPEARQGRRPGETRDEAFAEQAAANEAWRNYTRERDAPYPGLRSLLKHH